MTEDVRAEIKSESSEGQVPYDTDLKAAEPQPYVPKAKKHKEEQVQPAVQVEEGPALVLQEPELDSVGPWIQYNGIATLRIMDAQAWHAAGVKSDKYVEWNYLNNRRVPISHFTDAELAYLIGRDGRFSKVGA